MNYEQKYAEGSTLIRVPVSVRDKLIGLRRKRWPDRTYSPQESLGQVIARLVTVGVNLKAIEAKPLTISKKPVRKRGRKVNNKARRRPGRRHR